MTKPPLLSIAIPAYGRPKELAFGLYRLIAQIVGKHENEVEIVVSDDHTPDDALWRVRRAAERYPFVRYRRYDENVGLERNLIKCTEECRGEFLWIMGDDDFIEPPDGLDDIVATLKAGACDVYVLNRTRRSFDLSRTISDNWMRLDPSRRYAYGSLREFCLDQGFISIIGFISVDIFRRAAFHAVDPSRYYGTMYPQLGAMLEAFHDRPTLLIGRPMICHRTQTAEEKRAALGSKKTEADFMADVDRRNAIYFSHPYVAMLDHLMSVGAFSPDDIVRIPERTVIDGLLADFLIHTIELSHEMDLEPDPGVWARTAAFFRRLPVSAAQSERIEAVLSERAGPAPRARPRPRSGLPTISVVSPSFNQAEFLRDCLASVRDQTYAPIEHLVFDPGSTDGSREIVEEFPHATLVAEPDEGQSDALNKGFERARGDVIAWLNSDDYYVDDRVFETIAAMMQGPEGPDIVYGRGVYHDENGAVLRDVYVNKDPSSLPYRFQQEDGILQPALFMKRSVVERVGSLRKDLHYCMDYEYWIRCMKAGVRFAYIDENLAIARYHQNNKTYGMRGASYAEVCDMMKEHFAYVSHIWLKRYAEYLAEGHDGVLATAANAGLGDKAKFDAIYRRLLIAYNGDHDTFAALSARASERGYRGTLKEMKSLGLKASTPCKEIPLDRAKERGAACYTVGERRWAFDAGWKRKQIEKSHAFLRRKIAERTSDVCVVVGNGPSLNDSDLSLLERCDAIVSNNAFLSADVMKHATYYTVVNYLVAEQSGARINLLEGVDKVLPYWMAYCLNEGPNTYFVDAVGHPEFSTDIFKNMSWRHTVTFFNLHLAYGLGYPRVVLIGFDHNYVQPKGVAEQEIIQSDEEDKNHFHPGYFRGKRWQAADVNMMEEMYRLAKAAYEADGRQIINATAGGKLELFPREPLAEAVAV